MLDTIGAFVFNPGFGLLLLFVAVGVNYTPIGKRKVRASASRIIAAIGGTWAIVTMIAAAFLATIK